MQDFNPYDTLESHSTNISLLNQNMIQLARAFNMQSDRLDKVEDDSTIVNAMMNTLIDKMNQLVDLANIQDAQLQELHSRIRLLEVIRQQGTPHDN